MSNSKTEEALARSAALRDRARMDHIDSWDEITSTMHERRNPPQLDSLAPEKSKLSKAHQHNCILIHSQLHSNCIAAA